MTAIDRATLEDHLAQAECHVIDGEQHVTRQRELVARLEQDGDTAVASEARELLAQFVEMQAMHVADRDRLRRELDA